MKKDYSKYIGKRMTLKQLKEKIPNMRIGLSDYEFWYNPNKELKSGVVRAICREDEDAGDIIEQLLRDEPNIRLYFVSTTEDLGVTILW
jgi:hypothetical protein